METNMDNAGKDERVDTVSDADDAADDEDDVWRWCRRALMIYEIPHHLLL